MKQFKFSYLLIGFAALGLGTMWSNLFTLFHDGIMAYVAGIPTSIAIVGILSRSANLLPRVKSTRARKAGWIILGTVLVVEPIVLGMVNWWFMPPAFQSRIISYIVAGGASLVVSLVLVLGAVVDRSLIPAEKPKQTVAATRAQPRKPKRATRKQPITDDALLRYFAENVGATDQQVAETFGVTRQAIGKRRKKLYSIQN